jgi:phosphoglycerate dehydrogenase-like enzyme
MSDQRPQAAVLVPADEANPPGLDRLGESVDVRVVRTVQELDAIASDLRILSVYDIHTTLIPRIVKASPRLEWIHAASAGVDAVLTDEVVRLGITVTNARGVFDEAIAEYVLAGILAFTKDLPRTLRLQSERRWQHRETTRLRGQRMLVVGAGSIGREIGRLAASAGLELRGIASRERTEDPVFGTVSAPDALPQLLPWADVVVLAMPLTEATRGLIGAGELARCRPGAVLINIARGAVVDEAALIDALESDHLGGALLDVFEEEPLRPDHPFWAMEQVIVSPHMSGDAIGWRDDLAALFAENVRRWLHGEPLLNVVHGAPVASERRGRTR